MLLDLTISKLSPPRRAQERTGARLHIPRIESDELLTKFADVLRVALEDGLFDGSGCLNIVVQRAAGQ